MEDGLDMRRERETIDFMRLPEKIDQNKRAARGTIKCSGRGIWLVGEGGDSEKRAVDLLWMVAEQGKAILLTSQEAKFIGNNKLPTRPVSAGQCFHR